MRGRPIRVLVLLTLVPLLIVVVLLAVAALDGRGAERPRAPAFTRSRAVTGTCGSTITGAVTLTAGYSEFESCDSETVRGEISAAGGKTAVVIGGPDCAANTIDGALSCQTCAILSF